MRFTPAGLALSLALALTASVSFSAPPQPLDPRVETLLGEGRTALAGNDVDGAIAAFEAALAVQPGSPQILLDLAGAERRNGMQGKALHYYRKAQDLDPRNLAAIAGEGEALAEKGAVEKARRSLARLEMICGPRCPQGAALAAKLDRAPGERVVAADAVKPDPVVSN